MSRLTSCVCNHSCADCSVRLTCRKCILRFNHNYATDKSPETAIFTFDSPALAAAWLRKCYDNERAYKPFLKQFDIVNVSSAHFNGGYSLNWNKRDAAKWNLQTALCQFVILANELETMNGEPDKA